MVDQAEDSGASADARKCGVVAARTNAVAEKDVDYVVFRVNPKRRAGKSGVPDHGSICFGACRGIFRVGGVRFVESESAMRIFALRRDERVDGAVGKDVDAAVFAVLEEHVAIFGEVVSRGKESGIALHASRKRRSFVMDGAVDYSVAKVVVNLRAGNFSR